MADGTAVIQVQAGHTPLAFLLYLTKFVIEIDGSEEAGSWGERNAHVTPGPHTVRMWFRYMGQPCGRAEVSVDATDGRPTVITYRAPIFVFSSGKVQLG